MRATPVFDDHPMTSGMVLTVGACGSVVFMNGEQSTVLWLLVIRPSSKAMSREMGLTTEPGSKQVTVRL